MCSGSRDWQTGSIYRKHKRPFRPVCRLGGGRDSAGFGRGSYVCGGVRHRGAAPRRSRQPLSPIPGGGPSAALRDRGRIELPCGFRLASWLIRRSRGHSGWCTRCRPVVRWLQRAVLLEMGEDLPDGRRRFHHRHNPHRAAAVDPCTHVDGENALEALRPVRGAAARVGGAAISFGIGRFRVGGRTLAALRWRYHRAQAGVLRKDAVKLCEVRTRWRHPRREFGDDKAAGLPIWTTAGRPQGGAQGCAPAAPLAHTRHRATATGKSGS